MSKFMNVGKIDRLARIIVGAILTALPFLSSAAVLNTTLFMWGLPIVGLILIATGFISFCPVYRLIGANTAPKE